MAFKLVEEPSLGSNHPGSGHMRVIPMAEEVKDPVHEVQRELAPKPIPADTGERCRWAKDNLT